MASHTGPTCGGAREGTAGSQGPLGFLTPDGHERGARAHGADEEDLQVPAAAVGERQLDLHVLKRANEAAAGAIGADGHVLRHQHPRRDGAGGVRTVLWVCCGPGRAQRRVWEGGRCPKA